MRQRAEILSSSKTSRAVRNLHSLAHKSIGNARIKQVPLDKAVMPSGSEENTKLDFKVAQQEAAA